MHFVRALAEGHWNSPTRFFVRALENGTWRVDRPVPVKITIDAAGNRHSVQVPLDYESRTLAIAVEPGLVVSFGDQEDADYFMTPRDRTPLRAEPVVVSPGQIVAFHFESDAQAMISAGVATHMSEAEVAAVIQQAQNEGDENAEAEGDGEQVVQSEVGDEVVRAPKAKAGKRAGKKG